MRHTMCGAVMRAAVMCAVTCAVMVGCAGPECERDADCPLWSGCSVDKVCVEEAALPAGRSVDERWAGGRAPGGRADEGPAAPLVAAELQVGRVRIWGDLGPLRGIERDTAMQRTAGQVVFSETASEIGSLVAMQVPLEATPSRADASVERPLGVLCTLPVSDRDRFDEPIMSIEVLVGDDTAPALPELEREQLEVLGYTPLIVHVTGERSDVMIALALPAPRDAAP